MIKILVVPIFVSLGLFNYEYVRDQTFVRMDNTKDLGNYFNFRVINENKNNGDIEVTGRGSEIINDVFPVVRLSLDKYNRIQNKEFSIADEERGAFFLLFNLFYFSFCILGFGVYGLFKQGWKKKYLVRII